MTGPIHRCFTKATTAEGEEIRHSFHWVTARRGWLKVMPDALECGDWRIPYAEIDEAVLFSIRSALLIPGYVLWVRSAGRTWQFGLNPGRFWKGELPFPVRRETATPGYSPFATAVRIALLAAVIVWFLLTM